MSEKSISKFAYFLPRWRVAAPVKYLEVSCKNTREGWSFLVLGPCSLAPLDLFVGQCWKEKETGDRIYISNIILAMRKEGHESPNRTDERL